MTEKGTFPAPLSCPVRMADSAGRLEIVTFDDLGDRQKLGFLTEAIYLKASSTESEIGDTRKRSFLGFWEFRGPQPTLLTKLAGNSHPENPVLPKKWTFSGFWDPARFRTSIGVDFQKSAGKPDPASGDFWIIG